MIDDSTQARTVFVLGVCPRSGTNMLARLLCLHPDAALPDGVWEDYLLARAGELHEFAARCDHWWSQWGVGTNDTADLMGHIGQGLESFLAERSQSPVTVTKTPRVENLHLAPLLFPRSPVFVMIRDGRAAVESIMKTFDRTFEEAALTWRAGMRELRSALQEPNVAKMVTVVRYEELHNTTDETLRRVLDLAGLDVSLYDMDAALDMPVFGSSDLGGDVHWQPVDKPDDFDPNSRFAHWTPDQHARFNWLAAEEQRNFGYSIDESHPARPAHQRALDAKFAARTAHRRPEAAGIKRLVKKALGRDLQPLDFPSGKGWTSRS